ncbi:hypothetical protein FisN_15Lh065 [Fistulifera solaris]|uniref:Uncharacterized protein n=1 Tax=Fistulifera solaris TaxID=1519565 RepID=A0A1Z5KAR5_FISSO|nr:hypothetical protein FisN_15Lh065 [Fistulifera solaris]|eukprot:GAX23349.1 hypothetical protein FisN_15Lh065 [Fistulifera solaris]
MFKAKSWFSRATEKQFSLKKNNCSSRDANRLIKLIETFSAPLDWNDLELLATWFIPRTTDDQSGLVFRGLATRKDRTELEYVSIWLVNLVGKSEAGPDMFPIDVLAEVQFFLGMICEEMNDYAAAKKAYTACLLLQTQNEDPPERVAKTLFRLGKSQGRMDQPEERKSSWKRAFALMEYNLDLEELESLFLRRDQEEDTSSSRG